MKKLLLAVLLILLLNQIQSVHLKHQLLQEWHFSSEQEKQAYFNELLKTQEELNSSINELKGIADSYSSDIKKYSDSPTVQTQMYETALEDQRSKIFFLQNRLSLPLNSKSWACQNLTKEEAESVNQQIVETQKKIQILEEKLKSQKQCIVTQQTQKQIEFLKMYINHLSEELQNLCQKPASLKNFYLPYPKSNFVYGNLGQQGYKNKIQDALNGGSKTLDCPKEKPYPQNGQCITCQQQKAVYDLTQQSCSNCQQGQMFSQILHKCNLVMNSNPVASNYQGSMPVIIPNAMNCPSDRPFFNKEGCISCEKPSFFNFGANKCQTCQENLVFSLVTKLCGFKPKNTNPNVGNICCGTIIANPNTDTCPDKTPFYNGQQCIDCGWPTYFNLDTYTCTSCPNEQGFSLKQSKCIDSKYLEKVPSSTINENIQNYMGVPPIIGSEFENVMNCKTTQPFSNGKACQACQLPSYYNFQSLRCQVCQDQHKFDTKYHKCVPLNTENFNNNMTSLNNFIGPMTPFNSDLQTCPGDRPYFNGRQCRQCALPNYVDFTVGKCLQCKQGFIFNTFNRQCTVSNPDSYTNLGADNIYYNGDFNVVKQQIDDIKTNNQSAKQCQINEPFFNYLTNKCQKCTSETPLFDYKYNRCTQCPNGSQYNNSKHRCLTSGGVFPTLQRMIMNTGGLF